MRKIHVWKITLYKSSRGRSKGFYTQSVRQEDTEGAAACGAEVNWDTDAAIMILREKESERLTCSKCKAYVKEVFEESGRLNAEIKSR